MGSKTVLSILLFSFLGNALALFDYNLRPIIGILSQEPDERILAKMDDKNYTSFIVASYVKYIESAGARAVPILINQDDAYYESMASSVNGIIFPGGVVSITNTSGYGAAGQKLYDHVVKSFSKGIYLPLWGTCLGFEMITYLGANDHNWLRACQARNKADPITLQEGYMDSRIFEHMPDFVVDYVKYFNTTINFHDWCITPQDFTKSGLSEDFKVLGTSYDFDGLEYVALIEHESMPIYGSQFHPEKPPYEWANDEGHDAMPHDPFTIGVSHFFSNFFVNQARYNDQHFATEAEEQAALIYNYDTVYTGVLRPGYEECYFFR